MFAINQQLIDKFSQPSTKKSGLSDVGHLGLHMQRMDYALSCLTGINKENYQKALEERYEGSLLEYMTLMNNLGYLGRYGRTINPASYLVQFPDIQVSYLWLPKNACTNTKKLFATIYPEYKSQLKSHQFHETFQSVFGIEQKDIDLASGIQSLLQAKLLFCVIRDPIERLVSCYVDKFVKPIWMDQPFEGFIESYIKSTLNALGLDRHIRASITFREFLYSLMISENWSLDSHWRPQSDFLPSCTDHILFIDARDTACFCAALFDYLAPIHQNRFNMEQRHFQSESRANSSLGKEYRKKFKATGKCADMLPIQYSREDVKNYNDYPDSCMVNSLARLYSEDYVLRARMISSEQFEQIISNRFEA